MTSSVEIDSAELYDLFSLERDPESYSLNLSPSLGIVLLGMVGELVILYLSKIPSLAKGILKYSLLVSFPVLMRP